MSELSFQSAWHKLIAFFPERQIYLRAQGQVRYLILGTRTQIAAISGAAIVLLWALFTLTLVLIGKTTWLPGHSALNELRAEKERHVAAAVAEAEEARALLSQQGQEFTQIATEFQQQHQVLATLIGNTETAEAVQMVDLSQTGDRIMMSALERDVVPRASRTYQDAYLTIHDMPSADNPLGALRAMSLQQTEMMLKAEENAQERIETYRSILGRTGLNVPELLDAAPQQGQGGPLIELDDLTQGASPEFAENLNRVAARMNEAEAMENLFKAVPISAPVPQVRMTSDYGRRIDPFTKKPAYHSGLDFGGFTNMDILATGPGTVSYAGWRDGYGRVVEIDHGYGLKTRYAHMKKTLVKRGERVEAGDIVGGMGSSGRSTSTHLHYEVWYKGRPVNPENFVKAGTHVQ